MTNQTKVHERDKSCNVQGETDTEQYSLHSQSGYNFHNEEMMTAQVAEQREDAQNKQQK